MRVLHVHSGNLYGGIETLMVTLARERHLCPAMQPNFALCFDGRLRDELIDAKVPVYDLGNARISRPFSLWRARRVLNDLLKRETFDLAICHSAWTQAIFGKRVRAAGLPLVFWLHGQANGRHWLERWARRITPDIAICNSHFTAGTLPNLYPQVRAEMIYYPVIPINQVYSKDVLSQTRGELNTPNDAVVIIQVSRMEEWKGHRLHLEALSLLKDQPNWVCWMVGGAQRANEIQYFQGVKSFAKQLGIMSRIRFAGQRSDVSKLLSAADIHCQPNTGPEPFGITFIEAMNSRLPVVTISIGGAQEIIDESCGRLVQPGDAKALAASLRQLIEDRAIRIKLGEAASARARQLCDPEARMTELFNAITDLTRNEGCMTV